MKVKPWFLLGISLLVAETGWAQTAPTQQELETRLKSQFLMLRGMWDGERLTFDTQGDLVGTAGKRFFSESAVVVEQVQLSDTELEIRGRRAGLEFSLNSFSNRLKISAKPYNKEDIDITISRDPQRPEALDDAINQVFSFGIDEKLAAAAPFYWQWLLGQYLHLDLYKPEPTSTDQVNYPGGGVRNPILKYAPDDLIERAVNILHASGVSVIGLTVDVHGMPRNVHVVRPLGMGADEYAVAEVQQYRFEPAIYHGHGVPVDINIEVNFRPR